MASFLKAVGRAALVVIGIKLLDQLLKNKKREKPCRDPRVTVDRSNARYIPDQLIVWKKPGVSDADFNQWKRDHLNRYPGLLVKKLCANCDDSLELWEGDNVSTFISEKVASSGAPPTNAPPSGGGDAIAFYSYNIVIDLPEPVACIPTQYERGIELHERPPYPDAPIVIAVFDTGILPVLKGVYTNSVGSCMPGGNQGWNFAYKNEVTDDDYPSEHGSAVAKFIIDQEDKYKQQKINVLPVKVHNKYGKSDLFSILCGFAYAANCGAKIINASFGFYAAKGSQAPAILSQFVKKHLADKNILLIAAAGNVNTDESIGLSTSEPVRNLEQNPFFPACLSNDFENVITVTTVSLASKTVSPSQNFSNRIVDIGVNCDAVDGDNDFRFDDPLGRGLLILGSSYATPIVAGKIAQHYKAIVGPPPIALNKSLLLQKMTDLGTIKQDLALSQYIKDGNWMAK